MNNLQENPKCVAICRRIVVSEVFYFTTLNWFRDTRLRHCATSRKVEGSILDCDIGIFH
jgi:hypothetical protein